MVTVDCTHLPIGSLAHVLPPFERCSPTLCPFFIHALSISHPRFANVHSFRSCSPCQVHRRCHNLQLACIGPWGWRKSLSLEAKAS
jgi:hypothetical protein